MPSDVLDLDTARWLHELDPGSADRGLTPGGRPG
jgi:hypothetical protein